jgi:mercuric ion transport protein
MAMQTNREVGASERSTTRRSDVVVGAGFIAALASVSCCILPLGLFAAGISGAWISNLTALEPYQPVFIVAAVGLLAAGWRLAARSTVVCSDGSCVVLPRRLMRMVLWAASALVAGAIAFPYVAPALLGT